MFLAANPGPFTLDGTRTYAVGERRVAVIDPGPDDADHVMALLEGLRDADHVTLLVTHGHEDHVGAVDRLRDRLEDLGIEVVVRGAGHPDALALRADDVVATDDGSLVTIPTPGHTRDHLSFHWSAARGLFVGDLLLGEGDTTWVADYPGCVADYLSSLADLATLDLDVIYPTHGPPLSDPSGAIARFEGHRRDRIRQVRDALAGNPNAAPRDLVGTIHGEGLAPPLRPAALQSLSALIDYVKAQPEG